MNTTAMERDWLLVTTVSNIRVSDIGLAVYAETGIRRDEINGNRRDAETVTARHIVMYLARELTNQSYPQIGRELGGKDHTSVMNGHHRMAERLQADTELSALIARCKRRAMALAVSKNERVA